MAVQKKSLENLRPINENITPEQRKANGRKGGIKSGESRRQKRDMKNRIQELFEMSLYSGKIENFKNISDSQGKNLTVLDACLLKQIEKAMKGDTRAIEFLRDSSGMKPTEKQEITTNLQGVGKLDEIFDELKSED